MSPQRDVPELRIDAAHLYREEMFTDRRVGSIRRLVPVAPDGTDDKSRTVIFEGQTTLLTPAGPRETVLRPEKLGPRQIQDMSELLDDAGPQRLSARRPVRLLPVTPSSSAARSGGRARARASPPPR